jgi:hypothetical protein
MTDKLGNVIEDRVYTGTDMNRRLVLERGGVDAIAQSGRLRAVVEDVAEMSAARRTHDLGSNHPVARVGLGDHAVERRRLVEAGPTASRLELRVRAEQLRAASRAAIDPGSARPSRRRERALGALAAEDLVLLRRESRPPPPRR